MYVFFNDTATTEICTLSLHDALPIFPRLPAGARRVTDAVDRLLELRDDGLADVEVLAGAELHDGGEDESQQQDERDVRSEEHTSELQSRQYLVCRLLLEKKKIYLLLS